MTHTRGGPVRWVGLSLSAAALAAAYLATSPQPVSAAPFAEQTCSPCPQHEPVEYLYDSGDKNEVRPNPYPGRPTFWPDFGWADWDYPAAVARGQHYGSAIRDLVHLVYANPNVEELNFIFTRLELVQGLDYLSFLHEVIPFGFYTGSGGALFAHKAHRDLAGTVSFPFSRYPVHIVLDTLDSTERGFSPWSDLQNYETDDGFLIELASVCCSTPLNGTSGLPVLEDATRHQLMLLGQGDFLTFQYPNDRADTDSIVAIWENDVAPGARYDIYARCNNLPTHDVWDYTTAGSAETVKQALFLQNELCTVPGTWFILVHQESGVQPGTVNLVVTRHFESQRRSVSVGFNHTPANFAAAILTAENTVQKAARFFYGATEGTQGMGNILVYQSSNCGDCGGQNCDLCFSDDPGPYSHCCSGGHSTIVLNHWLLADLVAHEWGHQYLGLGDEYVGPAYACTHSMMGRQQLTNNLCIDEDHMRDPVPATSVPNPVNNGNWPLSSSPVNITTTQDSYNYLDHPLGGYVGRILDPTGPGGGGTSCRAGIGQPPIVAHLLLWLGALVFCASRSRKQKSFRRRDHPKCASNSHSSRERN